MAILAFAGIAIGCGGDESDAPPASDATEAPGDAESPDGAAAEGDTTVDIVEFLYEPEDVTVAAGSTITFVNQDKAPHTATADDSSFDTEKLAQGDEAEVTFDEPGSYSYYCRFHAFMKANVEVE